MGPADGWGLLPTVVRAFLAAANGHVDRLRAAVATADRETVQREAHSLRGAAANLGIATVAEVCRQLETDGGGGDELAVLERRLADACDELEALLATGDRRDAAP